MNWELELCFLGLALWPSGLLYFALSGCWLLVIQVLTLNGGTSGNNQIFNSFASHVKHKFIMSY